VKRARALLNRTNDEIVVSDVRQRMTDLYEIHY